MQQITFHCRRCGPFRIAESEVGASVYCPSCGREADAEPGPAEKEAGDVARSALPVADRRRIFSDRRAAELERSVLGEVVCPCGARMKYTLADVGGSLYCDRCGQEVRVGEPLVAASNPDASSKPAAMPTAASPARRPSSLLWTTALAVAVLGFLSLLSISNSLNRSLPESARETSSSSGIAASEAGNPTGVGAIAAGDGTNSNSEPDDSEQPLLPDDISLDGIRRLLDSSDSRSALFEAHYWQQVLRDHDVPVSDERPAELVRVIQVLLQRLTPAGQPEPNVLAAFRSLLAEVRQAIQNRNWADARRKFDQAQAMYEQHAQALAPFSRSLALLGAQIRQFEWEQEGVARLLAMLDESRQLAEKKDVTGAWERKAVAARLAELAVALSDADRERIKQSSAVLRDALRLAIGERAVTEAEACQKVGDGEMRDAFLQVVDSQLPGLPEEKIKPFIARALALKEKKLSKKATPLGRWLALRNRYESSLEESIRGETKQASAVCIDVWNRLQTEPPVDESWSPARIRTTVFELLEPKIQAALIASAPTPPSIASLVEAKETLDALSDWRDEPRWAALSTSVQRQIDDWARQMTRSAESLIQRDQYQRAAELLETAVPLHTAALDALLALVQAELALRADRKAEEAAWNDLTSLPESADAAVRGRVVEQFLLRYPDSAHRGDADLVKSNLIGLLRPRAEQYARQIRAASDTKDHASFLAVVREMESLPFLGDVAPETAEFREQRDRLMSKVESLMEAARRQPRLVTEDEILAARNALDELLAIDSGHAEAKRLQDDVRQRTAELVERCLKKAALYRGNRKSRAQNEQTRLTYRKLLQTVVRLDEHGPQGEQAKALLNEVNP